jgi:hypothetical protein
MTSQTSLPLKNKNRLYAFTSAFGIAPIAVNAVVLLICLMAQVGPDDLQRARLNRPELLYNFVPMDMFFFFLFLNIQSLTTAAFMFGFTANKRSSAAYFGLPLKRSGLFLSRGAAGLILIFVPHLIHYGIKLAFNLSIFSSNPYVWSGFFIMLGTTLTFLLLVYAVTTLLILRVGTVQEGLIFSLVFLYGTVFAVTTTQSIVSFFLHGNAWGELYNLKTIYEEVIGNWFGTFWLPISVVNTLNSYEVQVTYGWEGTLANMGQYVPSMLLVWAVVAVSCCVLAFHSFKRYKAENSGALGVNGVLNFIMSAMISYLTLCSAVSVIEGVGFWTKLILGFAVSIAVFILCRFLLTLNLRRTFEIRKYRAYLCVPGAVLAIVVGCLTGGFGYSKAMPDLNEVTGASVTYTGAPDFIPGGGETFGNFYLNYEDDQDIFVRDYSSMDYDTEIAYEADGDAFLRAFESTQYKTREDIEKVLRLHKALIDAGGDLFGNKGWIKQQIHIHYHLENGKVFDRFYKSVPPELAVEMLQTLDGTDFVNESAANATKLAAEALRLAETGNFNKADAVITVADALMTVTGTVTGADGLALLTALQNDIGRLTHEEKYFPQAQAKAVISFPRYKYSEDAVLRLTPFSNYDMFTNFNNISVVGDGGSVTYSVGMNLFAEQALSPLMLGPSTDVQRFYITEGYAETLAFLKEKGYALTEPGSSGIAEMSVERYNLNPSFETQSLYFRSYQLVNPENSVNFKDVPKERYGELLSAARTHYFINEGGYLLHMDKPGEKGENLRVTLFLPEADAPEFVKEMFR